jgi:lysophospholipase L1-like esterase
MEPVKNDMDALSYLALGDSYTIGESVDSAERWPVQLSDTLRGMIDVTIGMDIIARTGWTTGDLIRAIEEENPAGPYDLVSLLIGVNNQYQGRDTAEYRVEFAELLQTAVTLAGNIEENVIVLSIPDYGVTPFAGNKDPEKIAREIDAFNTILIVHIEPAI